MYVFQIARVSQWSVHLLSTIIQDNRAYTNLVYDKCNLVTMSFTGSLSHACLTL